MDQHPFGAEPRQRLAEPGNDCSGPCHRVHGTRPPTGMIGVGDSISFSGTQDAVDRSRGWSKCTGIEARCLKIGGDPARLIAAARPARGVRAERKFRRENRPKIMDGFGRGIGRHRTRPATSKWALATTMAPAAAEVVWQDS